MNSIAVVLLNYNGLELLKQFLPKAIMHSKQASVVLVDNASNDNSMDWVKTNYPEIKCIELKSNLGYAGGYNEGLKHVKAQYYALVNTDVELTEGWLTPLLNHFDSNPSTVALQPHILDFNKRTHFEYAGAAGGYIDALGIPFCRGRILNHCEVDQGQYDQSVPIFWASGACFLIRSSTFWELGGFDTRFFAHQEEIDLCWRIFNEGYNIQSIGESKVYHIGGATLPPSSKKIFLNHRNSLLMCAKNLPDNARFKILLKKLILDGVIGIVYALKLNFKATLAIIRAHFSFYKMLKNNQLLRKKSSQSQNYFLRKNIIIDFFVLRRLNFKDLNKNYK
jgi:GT2 family glycosyltransferase